MVDFGMDPQEAIDAERFVVAPNGDGIGAGCTVAIEAGIPDSTVEDLRRRGHNVRQISALLQRSGSIQALQDDFRGTFGRGQIIARHPESGCWWAGSDPRADGCAFGW